MENFAVTVLMLTALALPVGVFLVFRPRSRANTLVAAAVAIAAGWAFNVACIYATEAIAAGTTARIDRANVAIAVNFGWICPLVLVLGTWLVWRVIARRASPETSPRPVPPRGAT
jgi:hypothetical protein